MKFSEKYVHRLHFYTSILSVFLLPGWVSAADDTATLRQQLIDQKALIMEQQQELNKQSQALEKLSKRLDERIKDESDAEPIDKAVPQSATPTAAKGITQAMEFGQRDSVGDLNSSAVSAGDFPGAFKIPGSKDISLAIGGFVKTVAISDSDAEAMGADFTPANLGTKRSDTDGAFNVDSTLTKLFLDGRAPARNGQLRGYIECDLNKSNNGSIDVNMRHAYGSWRNSHGTLLAGHTWSTLMDLKILPESITEPTVSGAIFMRQPQIRWSQPLTSSLMMHVAIEDPSSSDVFDQSNSPELGNTRVPDGVFGLEYDRKTIGHIRLNGILREIKVDLPARDDSEVAWGLSLTGHLEFRERDNLKVGFTYGQGLGRYLLGIQSTAGSVINQAKNELDLRDNWGGFVAYQYHWTDTLRSSAMAGYAKSESYDWQPVNTFESSRYAAANLMWQVLPYLTMGAEYAYGQRENKDGSDLDNNRVAVGVQFY